MKPIRLIALDMDGTLLTRINPVTACVPPENAAALRRCANAGIHLALASGRMPDDAAFYAADAGISMHVIGLNGGVVLDAPFGEPSFTRTLPPATAQYVFDILMKAGVDVIVFGLWEVASVQPRPLSWAQRELGTWFGRPGGRLAYHTGVEHALRLLHKAGKIVAISEDVAALAAAREAITRALPEVSVSSSWHNNFEVNPAGVDKGAALTQLAAHLGVPMDQVMAIGDNGNDVPMLSAAGVGVAMGNATPDAIRAADLLTLPCTDFGVAAAIRAVVFGESIDGVIRR